MAEIKEKALDLTKINEIIDKHGWKGERGLIAVLQDVQGIFGYLPEKALNVVSTRLKISRAKIYGVCTFYSQFRLKPLGKYVIQVCDGTACHVRGSNDLIEEIKSTLGVNVGDTTEDGLFTIETVACLGACGLAPAMVINGETYAKLTPKLIDSIVEEYRKKG